ncbi:hypothetical protein SADUNF_SadunfMtG0004900 (mitochondrion) [Salix dunnii]|uniref:Small ribosomal subunit protein uS7 domain-containing protein n=1 Tax=Salix dunnii TaxID=1413687 RepID=A0A835MBY1_9ROSI|nr:hypothetical protein SADUNF_SadunfMtG0004900 [Salix dunnii]
MGSLDGEQKQLIKKLVNFRMKEGKRTRVRAIVYQTFHRPARTERDVIKLMVDAIENIKPICEVEKVGVAAFKRRISYRISLEKCSFAEILDAYRKRGIARKKRENLHGLASTNRSFAHFRWWTPPFAKMCFYIVSFSAQVVESLKGKSKGSPLCNELRDREGAKQSQCPQICYWVVTVNQMNRLYLFFSIGIDRAESNPLARFERRRSLKGKYSSEGKRRSSLFLLHFLSAYPSVSGDGDTGSVVALVEGWDGRLSFSLGRSFRFRNELWNSVTRWSTYPFEDCVRLMGEPSDGVVEADPGSPLSFRPPSYFPGPPQPKRSVQDPLAHPL